MISRKKVISDFLFNIPIFFCILFSLFSPAMIYKYSTLLGVFPLLLLIILAFVIKKRWGVNEFYSVLLYSYLIIIPRIMGYGFISNRYLVLSVYILGGLISCYCEYADKWKSIGCILKIVSPFLAYVYIKTFFALLRNPYASRAIKTSGAYTMRARAQGIGGYEFIFFLSMLPGICTGLFFLLKKRKHKWLCLCIGILSYMEVVLSNYMTALLIATVGIVLTIIVFLIKKNRVWAVFWGGFAVFFGIFGNTIMKFVIEIFISVIPQNGKTFLRLNSMKDAFFQSILAEFLSDRLYTLERSMACLLKYPFLGIVGRVGLNQEELLAEIGQHSYFMDTFAFYGGIIGILALVNYFSIFKKRYFNRNLIIITIPTMICGFLLLMFNNITLSIGIVLGIIYPYALHLLRKQEMLRI